MSALEAMQEVLADEHAALWTYGLLGARTSQSEAPPLFDTLSQAYRRHRARRDRLRLMITEAGGDPVPAAAAYDVDGRLLRPEQLRRAALAEETASVEVLLSLVARSSGETRAWALGEATWSAAWQLRLGGTAQTWPGAPELV